MKQFLTTFFGVLLALAAAILLIQHYTKARTEQLSNAAFLAQGVSDAVSYRMAIAEHWQDQGELACTREQLNYAAYDEMASRSLATIDISGCGELTLRFDQKTGVDDGTIVLRAKVVNDGSGQDLDWQCVTNDYPNIKEYLPQCSYDADFADTEAVVATAPVQTPTESASDPIVIDDSQSCRQDSALYGTIFTDQINRNTPLNRIVTIGPDREEIIFFSEILGAGGQQVTHRWYHNNVQIVDIPIDVLADRWPTSSSQLLGLLGPGTLRVEVRRGDCVIGQESVLIAAREIVDPIDSVQLGWMRPAQALETVLARQATETAIDNDHRGPGDEITENGDTLLIQAIRNHDEVEALRLIESIDVDSLNDIAKVERLSREDYQRYTRRADPFLKAADGATPLQLAKTMGMDGILEALEKSILKVRQQSRARKYPGNSTEWGDSVFANLNSGNVRFDDGDTPLHQAVRTNNERAVATMLGFGLADPASDEYKALVDVYAFDRAGQQALDIARANAFTGVEHLLSIAEKQLAPSWAVLRATFAMEILDDQPNECRKVAFEDESEVYFYAELADIKGRRVIHEWWHDEAIKHSQSFYVTDDIYVSASMRKFSSDEVGHWKVIVRLENGASLSTHRLNYRAHDQYSIKKRASYTGHGTCELGLGTLYALVKAHAPVAKINYLFDNGLKFEPRRSQFKDVFLIALEDGNITLVRWFLERGFGLEREVKHRKSPMTVAAENGDAPMMLYLLNKGAELTQENGARLLRNAAYRNLVGVTKILLDRGVDPNQLGREGATPLGHALSHCNLGTAVLLLQAGAEQRLLLSEHSPELPENRSAGLKEHAGKCIQYKTWSMDDPAVEYLLAFH